MTLEEQLEKSCVKDLSKKTMDNIAKKIAEYWTFNCPDEEFHDNCIENICQEIKDYHTESCGKKQGQEFCTCCLVYNIWNIVENKYLNLDMEEL